ncbi:hypothetical protein DL769_002919 [Monosporascus sp. CRB-8-3]|nr:hypothetical protein DL769_002919 [Monosporascus sp. CRB-8-3]
MPITPNELSRAAATLAYYLNQAGVTFSISGGAAGSLLRQWYNMERRATDDIDLVVQPDNNFNAETISKWLYETYPDAFSKKTVYGVSLPTLVFVKDDGSKVHIDIEIFDVGAWPQRPQYDLSNATNERITVTVDGVSVPIFGATWQLREKIVTAYERQGSNKERTDLDDAEVLLDLVQDNVLDLTQHEEAVRHFVTKRPGSRRLLQLKVYCPAVLGDPWTWYEEARVYFRFEGNIPKYLDETLRCHDLKWDKDNGVYYLTSATGLVFWVNEAYQLVRWT